MELNEKLQSAGRYLFLLPENKEKNNIFLNQRFEVRKNLHGNDFIWLDYGEDISQNESAKQLAYDALVSYIIKKEISARETLLFLQLLKNLCHLK